MKQPRPFAQAMLAAALAALLLPPDAQAAPRFARSSSTWTAATWSATSCAAGTGAAAPAAGDDVTICGNPTPRTVTLNTNTPNLGSVTVQAGGTLVLGNNGTMRTMTVAGDFTNAGTVSVQNSTVTHMLNVGGDITNSGTFDLVLDGNSLCNVTFTGSGTQTVSGAGGTTQFNRIFINMAGASINNIVDVTATNFSLTGTGGNGLNFTDGTFRLSVAQNISPFASADYTIPANARLWLNANATLTSTNDATVNGVIQVDAGTFTSGTTVTVAAGGLFEVNAGTATVTGGAPFTINGGTMRITGGTVNAGNAANESITINNDAASAFEMTSGTLNVAGRITNSAVGGAGSFTLSDGTITVGINGNTLNSAAGAPFYIASGMNFTMSGGTIIIQSPNAQATAREFDVNSALANSNVTGGTVQIGNASTAAGQTFQIESVPPVHNLTINTTNSPTVDMDSDITVNNILTLGSSRLIADTFTLSVAQVDCTVPSIVRTTGRVDLAGGGRLLMRFPAGATDCTFPVGEGANDLPVRLNFSSVGTAGNIALSRTTTEHPDSGSAVLNLAAAVNRYWTLSGATAADGPTAAGTYDATFDYLVAETDGGATAGNFVMARGTSCSGAGAGRACSAWSHPILSGAASTTQITAPGLTLSSGGQPTDFAVGETTRFTRETEFIYSREQY